MSGLIPSAAAQATASKPHPATGKPMLPNPGGSVSTEQTITIEQEGMHYVIPTIVRGKRQTPDEAVRMFREGANKPVGVFETEAEANSYAKRRSKELGEALRKRR